MDELRIPRIKWLQLLYELKCKGAGYRESGAFLLGKLGDRKVCHYICYDELDENAFSSGCIVLRKIAWIRLWDYCAKNKMHVLADVHTHPSQWTSQSHSDKHNPMVSQSGHIALIVPNYAKHWWRGLRGVGIHEYISNNSWNIWAEKSGKVKLVLL